MKNRAPAKPDFITPALHEYGRSPRSARAVTLAALAMGLSIPLVILAAALPQVRAGYSRASCMPSAASPFRSTGTMTARSYFHSGQWRADLRTLAAVVRYAVQPEPDLPILTPKSVIAAAAAPGLLATTNVSHLLPRA